MNTQIIKRALISVFDKTGLVPFAKTLAECGVEIISTGGTARVLRDSGIAVVKLEDYTGFPEMLDGRVKTLHPKVHGGLLFVRGNAEHEKTVQKHGIKNIDLVVVNLYPFEKTVATEGVTHEEVIENIDIGGPALMRSAAKNHASVTVVCDVDDYERVGAMIAQMGGTALELRKELAAKVFARTSSYDAAIAAYLDLRSPNIDPKLSINALLVQPLRYGENPHQKAALYGNFKDYYQQLQGKELSYNNILDLTAAAELIHEFRNDAPTVAILKHLNPCGVGQGRTVKEAWDKAFATDTQAPFGGIIASSVPLDGETAAVISGLFSEVIVAPDFTAEALEFLQAKKNVRLIRVLKDVAESSQWRVRSVGPNMYVSQEADAHELKESEVKVVTKRAPTKTEMKALLFGWRVAKHVKSNAIVYAAEDKTLAIGAGQMSRIDSTKLAVWKAKEAGLSLQGSALASDAFFPFPDGLIAASEAGATAIIQPGGALKDAEVIAAADERGLAMVFTGVRHFRH